jgi:hypothetical protein
MTETPFENSASTPTVAVLVMSASLLALPPLPAVFLPDNATTSGVRIELENGSSIVGWRPRPLDYALDSPDSVPPQLRDFAARGFERRNRWS